MNKPLIFLLTSLTMSLTGCFGDDNDFNFDDGASSFDNDWGSPSDERVIDATMSGQIGDEVINTRQYDMAWVDSYSYRTEITVFVDTEGGGRAMVQVSIWDELTPGDTYEGGDIFDDEMSVLGCSGPADHFWDFDQHAKNATAEVSNTDRDGVVRVTVDATFANGESVHVDIEVEL